MLNKRGIADVGATWLVIFGIVACLEVLNHMNIIGKDSPRTVEKNRAKVLARGDTINNLDNEFWEPIGGTDIGHGTYIFQ